MHVRRVLDAGVAHRGLHALRDLLHHGGAADIFGQQLGAHGGADGDAGLSGRPGLGVAGEYGRVRRNHAVAAAGPHHGNVRDVGFAAVAALLEHGAERLIGQNAGEIVDAAIAFGLADHRNHLVGAERAGLDACFHAGSVHHGLQLHLGNHNSH